ncbi:histidine phosphatase family protein [Fodinicola feengrottensis]|uniref:histidine phosphatase family protein n=1 Tax=Fodinicola feengrottensis TaxID=435914 RepID=UPI002440F72F|nr:histidine phosphatase family protein [Fodinicola feengrottensis]
MLLIRHGQTEWAAAGRHTGRTDVPLTAVGEQQAKALRPLLAELLGDTTASIVLSSPMERARRTAELAGLSVTGVDPDLAEMDYGAYEGMTTPEISRTVPGFTVWTHPLPGGETPAQVGERADAVLSRVGAAGGTAVLVAHGHLLRVLGARWVGLDPTGGGLLALGTAAVCVLGREHGRPVLRHWNLQATNG